MFILKDCSLPPFLRLKRQGANKPDSVIDIRFCKDLLMNESQAVMPIEKLFNISMLDETNKALIWLL